HRAQLAYQDASRVHGLAAEHLHPAALPGGIAAVARAALSLFVSHCCCPVGAASAADRNDLHFGVGLPVALATGPAFLFLAEVQSPAGLALSLDLGAPLAPLDQRLSDLGRIGPPQPDPLRKGALAAALPCPLLEADPVALGHAVLLPAGTDDCVHRTN